MSGSFCYAWMPFWWYPSLPSSSFGRQCSLDRNLGVLILLNLCLSWVAQYFYLASSLWILANDFVSFTGSYLVNWSPNLQTAVSDLVCENLAFFQFVKHLFLHIFSVNSNSRNLIAAHRNAAKLKHIIDGSVWANSRFNSDMSFLIRK